jgi:cyclopropane fatty-acyl-phospholipid synthase-like methyltransferase
LFKNIIGIGRVFESILGDTIMNVNTRGSVYFKEDRGKFSDAFSFETTAHTTISKTIRFVHLNRDDVVFVFGCGKGRTVCHFARKKVRKVIGIEISDELSKIAKKNIITLKGKKAEVEIRNEDAAVTDVSEGTVFYMFNPFGEKTLKSVIQNIEKTHKSSGKSIKIIYVRPLFYKVFEEFPWLKIIADYKRLSGLKILIYQNK